MYIIEQYYDKDGNAALLNGKDTRVETIEYRESFECAFESVVVYSETMYW